MRPSAFLLRASLLAGTFGLVSCGGGGEPTQPPGQAPVATVVVSPPTATLAPQETSQLSAQLRDAGGNTLTGRTVSWSTSDGTKASVSNSGLVTAVAGGSATITATSEGKSGSAQVTVTAPVATVEVTASSTTLVPQQTLQLTVVTKDGGGTPLTGRVVTFTSSQSIVATVSGTGLVTALTAGTTTITATSETRTGTVNITVVAGTVVGPTGGTLTAGNGDIEVTVPPGALPTATPITLVSIPTPTTAPPARVQFNGPAYQLGPAGQTFAQPVTVKLRYHAANIPRWAMTGDVSIYRSSGAQWLTLTDIVVDTVTKTVLGKTTAFGAPQAFLRPSATMAEAAGDPPVVTTGVADPTINLTPTTASVNFQQRSVSFDVSLVGTGSGMTKPVPGTTGPTPQWKFRWRTTGAHGVLGGGGFITGWSTSSREQYIANDPNLNGLTGVIDQVFVDVLLNPAEENNPSAHRIITAQQAVDADLQITYEITPANRTIGPGVAQNFQLVMRDRQGNILQPLANHVIGWTSSGNQGTLVGGNQVTSTYTSKSTFTTPPPRVDDIEVEIEGRTFVQERVITWDLTTVPGVPQMVVTMKPKEERKLEGKAKVFVTVKVDYTVALQSSGQVSEGATKQLNVVLTPAYNGPGLKYKYTNPAAHGTLDVTNGARTDATQVTYTAKDFLPGTDQVSVTVVSFVGGTELETLGTGTAAVEVDPWRAGSCTSDRNFNGASYFEAYQLRVAKVTGGTSYEIQATTPDPYGRTFAGATSADPRTLNQVLDGGSYWAINLDGGFYQSTIGADGKRAANLARCGQTTIKFKVTGTPPP